MRQLLREDVEFCWNPECDRELQYLKSCLMSEPILVNTDPNKNFVIMCDAASNTGCGYQILQEGSDGRLHAVSYDTLAASRTGVSCPMFSPERNRCLCSSSQRYCLHRQ